jgi:putative endonuclease
MKQPCTYLIANKSNSTLYIGVTSNLVQRIWQHKEKQVVGFTHKYNIDKLVYYEQHNTMSEAIVRENQLKKWRRQWKINLIETHNPHWEDLWLSIL